MTAVWSSVSGFDGQLTWIPKDFDSAPVDCVCGAHLQVTELAHADDSPIELTCDRGHRWRDAIVVINERLAAKGGSPAK